ncbi:hypothetical protein B0T26DRAFT_767790 [Lasiosphaeria miniovina]|uniref:Uncharacterized protein n=1 Tax=Lasiosphaeria miniovina TaxID=1954250 RepID=A0AA40B629_9PEZI|nr:uncharacterized protein B0T26DRAFT_767790 [Lasiosphaeria miniovina]KAK0728352.1 hypothetical protein B0T26DRAFT_767790 [Lasiosphaeria miniovina]
MTERRARQLMARQLAAAEAAREAKECCKAGQLASPPTGPSQFSQKNRLTEDHQSAQPGHGMSTRARKAGHGAPGRVLSQEQKRLDGLEKEWQKKRKLDARVCALSSATGLKTGDDGKRLQTKGYRRPSTLQTRDGRARAIKTWRTDSTGRPLHSGRHVQYILSFSHYWLAHVIRDSRVHEKSIESNGHLWAGSSARPDFGTR